MAKREQAGFDAREHEPAGYRLRRDVTITSSANPQTSRKQYYIKSEETGEVFELGEEEYFFCVRLDGRVSFAEFRHAFEAHFDTHLTFEKFTSFAEDLVDMRLLERTRGDAFAAAATALIEDILDPEDTDPRATPFRRTLLDPSRFFESLSALAPLGRVISYALLPLLVVAFTIFAHNMREVLGDIGGSIRQLSIFVLAPIGLFAVNLMVKIVEGATAHREGSTVRGLGVIFFFGVFPRFYVDENAILALGEGRQRRVYAAALRTRLFIGAVAMILWAVFRPGGGFLPTAFILISHVAFGAFLWSAIPLIKNDGYRWLALFLGQPMLRERSLAYLQMRLRGRPAPPDMTPLDQTSAFLFAVASLIYLGVVLLILFAFVSVQLEGAFGGPGVALAIALLGMSVAWYLSSRHAVMRVRETMKANRVGAAGFGGGERASELWSPPPRGDVIELKSQRPRQSITQPLASSPGRKNKHWPRFVWFAGGLAFLVLLLLPYQYKPGGEFEVLPNHRFQVNARIDGEIAEIMVKEGQWVEENQPLVRLNNWQLQRALIESEAELDSAKAVLARLLEGAKAEEIAFAESQVASASSRLSFKRSELERAELLLNEGFSTARSLELKRSEYGAALSDVQVAKANLAVVKSAATQAELDAARAQVRRYENEVAFRKEDLDRTLITALSAGAVMTANVDLKAGSSLKTGDLVVEIEDTRTARVEINLAESDVRYVKIGDRVQIKPWGFSNETLIGSVIAIAPSVDSTQQGRSVRVLTDLPNDDQRLRPQMSGYAKVEGETMQVWRAYLLFFIRFVEVEVWSWFP